MRLALLIGLIKFGFLSYVGFEVIFSTFISVVLSVVFTLAIMKFRVDQLSTKTTEAWLQGCFQKSKKCFFISHRGENSDAPENTINAFETAINKGASAIELDLRLSKDKHIVVIHNPTVDETTDGKGFVSSFTLEQLKALNIVFRDKITTEKIPTLQEVANLCVARNVRMVLDVKTSSHSMARCLSEFFHSYPIMYEIAIVVGFKPQVIYWLRRLDDKILTGLTYKPHQHCTDASGMSCYENDIIRYYLAVALDILNQFVFHHVSWMLIGNSFCLLHKSLLCASIVCSIIRIHHDAARSCLWHGLKHKWIRLVYTECTLLLVIKDFNRSIERFINEISKTLKEIPIYSSKKKKKN